MRICDAAPDDVAALKAALAAERAKGLEIAAELAVARAKASKGEALIAQQKLQITKLKHQIYGQRSERSARLIEQLALPSEELEADATEDELAAEQAVAKTTTVRGFTRKRAERQTFPKHLPRERVVIDGPTACECCGSNRLRKPCEDVTRTLEVVPRQWKVRRSGRSSPAAIARRSARRGRRSMPSLGDGLARASCMIMFEKFGQHQPLNRQAEALRAGRRADRTVDHSRCRWGGLCVVGSPAAPGGSPCDGGRAPSCR
ncbi:IS66 family transposase [Bradyrhizobium sp. USDA 4486]